jgi:hypothetical protein
MARDWLKTTHPIYDLWRDAWMRNERRLRGGEAIADELTRFDWETVGGDHYKQRQSQATYMNFPDMFAADMCGHLMRARPTPGSGLNFGALGEIPKQRNFKEPTFAELVYYNTDGVGNDGSQWDNFWDSVERWAMATGHRWLMVEAPARKADGVPNKQDVIDGLRPYLIHLSPLAVPWWNISQGRLDFVIVNINRFKVKIESGKLSENQSVAYKLLMVRTGCTMLDDADTYSTGGWWLYDDDGELVIDPIAGPQQGDWGKTSGAIPCWPHFYQRDDGAPVLDDKKVVRMQTALSRSAITDLGNAAVAHMNLGSAADFDAWDAGMSMNFMIGVDESAWAVALDAMTRGSRWIPLKRNPETQQNPVVQDASTGAVPSTVFATRLEAKRTDAMLMAVQEVTSVPDSSGASKQAGFTQTKSPRLALMASELEASQNTAIHFLEMRFGFPAPTGSVSWPRDFDLGDVLDRIEEHFSLEKLTGLKSPTLGAKMMTQSVIQRGLVTDDADLKTIEGEYGAAGQAAKDRADQQAALAAQLAGAGNGGPPDVST